jgi:hypothetical protein
MKSIIILILLVGTAISQVEFTADTATKWTLGSADPSTTTGITYDFTVRYGIGAATGATTQVATVNQEIGLICIVTASNFSLADGVSGQVGWAMVSIATGTTTIGATTGWGNMLVWSLSAITKTTDTSLLTGATGTACTTTNVLPTTLTNQEIYFLFDISGTCTNLPLFGAVDSYARCFHKAASTNLVSANAQTLAVSSAKNVTIGASTFAAGATILAGIAYLQF